MHGLKNFSLSIVLSALLSVSAHAVDEDGTFTITIQGPEEEQIQQVAPRQTAPRRANVATNVQRRQPTRTVDATNNPNRQARTTPRVATTTQSNATTTTVAKTSNIPNFANDRRYEVKAGDTIWSVAHRYLPQDRSFNEFQIVASIYRHNPKAFANNNVNALQKTTLVIPDDKLMALESAQIGSALLSRGTLQMPALDYSSLTKTDTPKVETTTTVTTTTTTPTTTETKVAKKEETPKSEDETLPVYEATETKIKRLQEEEAKKELSQLTPNDDPNAQNENKNAKNKELIDLTKGSTAIDVKAINLMLDENKKMVESKLRVLENQLAEALERMKKSSAATAKTATDSVATLAGQYDNIIAKIQQDLIEIKGNINRLSQDNDRLREMLLANDEKIEDMQLQLSQFSITVPESSVDLNKPVMMILFGAGLLALVMIVLFIIFKAKYRSNQRVLTDDFDVDDGSYDSDDTSLLSDENGSVEIETPTGEEYEDETEPNKEEPKKEEAQDNKDNKENKEETAKTEESPVEADTSTPKEEDSVQKAWDEAANTKAEEPKADKAVLDEWSQALDEQEQQENKQVDVSRNDESVADAWADALKEQNNAENNTEEAKSASSSLDDDMSAWTEAFKEQEESQDHELPPGEASVSTEQKDMADAWAKALEEQEKEAKEAQVSDAVETPVEDEKVKENSADIPEAQTTLEDQTSEPASDTQSTQEAEIAKAMANSSAPSVDVAEAEASKVESQETLDHDYLQEHDQDAVKVEDVNEDELLNQISGNVDDALKQADETEETATTNTVASPDDRTLEPSKEDVVAEDSKDESKALAEDDIANATLSGEEKALLDSLAKHQEQVAQDETVDAEFETDNAAQTAPEKEQDSDSHKVDPKLGTKVDEVLNDDLDLEDILAQNNDSEVIDAVPEEVQVSDENAEVASAIEDTEATPQDNEVTAEPQVEEAVIDEPVAVAEPEPKTNEKASTQDVAEDTVAEEPTPTEIDANTDDLVQDNLDESSNSDEKTSEQGVVSWAVPNDDYDVVQAHKEQAQAEDTTTQLQDDTGAEETVTEPSDTLDQNENEEEPSETIVEDEDVAANVNTEADTEVVDPQEEVVTTEPVETNVEETKTEPQANAEDSQALDTQTVDSEPVADVDTADESSADDLRELEIRLGASRADYDPGADQDLMNMLGGSNEEPALDEHHDLQGDVGSMLSDEIAKAASKSELETVDPQNEVLEQVFDKIGPISAIDPSEESDTITSEADTTLDNEQQNSKEYQYYVDELNLARLYFETGDTEEAIKIIDDVKENATDDLKEEAIKIMQSYGN